MSKKTKNLYFDTFVKCLEKCHNEQDYKDLLILFKYIEKVPEVLTKNLNPEYSFSTSVELYNKKGVPEMIFEPADGDEEYEGDILVLTYIENNEDGCIEVRVPQYIWLLIRKFIDKYSECDEEY